MPGESRIGRRPIPIPKGVQVKLDGNLVTVKGPKGELKREIHPDIGVEIQDNVIKVFIKKHTKKSKALHGLFNSLIWNMVKGVTEGFKKTLEIVGVGYRAELKGRTIVLNLGYSNPVEFELPKGIDAQVERSKIVLMGIDKELVGETAAKIRRFRPPEPYKGKGIRYEGEVIIKKAGKGGGAK